MGSPEISLRSDMETLLYVNTYKYSFKVLKFFSAIAVSIKMINLPINTKERIYK